jgi:hypothetical protein
MTHDFGQWEGNLRGYVIYTIANVDKNDVETFRKIRAAIDVLIADAILKSNAYPPCNNSNG